MALALGPAEDELAASGVLLLLLFVYPLPLGALSCVTAGSGGCAGAGSSAGAAAMGLPAPDARLGGWMVLERGGGAVGAAARRDERRGALGSGARATSASL
jgi:hypothetical protein